MTTRTSKPALTIRASSTTSRPELLRRGKSRRLLLEATFGRSLRMELIRLSLPYSLLDDMLFSSSMKLVRFATHVDVRGAQPGPGLRGCGSRRLRRSITATKPASLVALKVPPRVRKVPLDRLTAVSLMPRRVFVCLGRDGFDTIYGLLARSEKQQSEGSGSPGRAGRPAATVDASCARHSGQLEEVCGTGLLRNAIN